MEEFEDKVVECHKKTTVNEHTKVNELFQERVCGARRLNKLKSAKAKDTRFHRTTQIP